MVKEGHEPAVLEARDDGANESTLRSEVSSQFNDRID